ncbi:subunit 17 of mediator complex-domain-containing protein [Geopyxis carbonaria]|nr:subunit 17 of mediator complex-domain-containing protein [Geopyxis carbonaria]
MTDSDPLLLTLQPYPDVEPEPEDQVALLIQRIQAERGFKNVNESILLDEIQAGEGRTEAMDVDEDASASAPEKGDEESEKDPMMKLQEVKHEMIGRIENARNEALLALDYVSLLVSLQQPEIGRLTMSPDLRRIAPVGSLGFQKITRKIDVAAIEKDAAIAKKWKIDGLNNSADLLRRTSQRLVTEGQKEARYWEQVMAIREDGWLITRMPREKGVLGVKYGFAETAPELYKDKGIGALRRQDDGSVMMDDSSTSGSLRNAVLRVRIMKGDEVLGMSVPKRIEPKADGSSVRDKLERARNFIYEEELFFEMMKEARSLANAGVKTTEDAAIIEAGDGRSIILDMVPPDDEHISSDPSNPNFTLAQGIYIAMRILLSYSHRQNLKKRSRVPIPLTNRKPPVLSLPLLRPIITQLYHHTALVSLTTTLTKIRTFFINAGLQANCNITPLQNCLAAAIAGVESAVEAFMSLAVTQASLSLPGGWKLDMTMQTSLANPHFGTAYTISTSHDGAVAKLQGAQRFASWQEAIAYLFWCVEMAAINHIRMCGGGWEQEAGGREMSGKGGKRIRVEVDGSGFRVKWGGAGGKDRGVSWVEEVLPDQPKLEQVLAEI